MKSEGTLLLRRSEVAALLGVEECMAAVEQAFMLHAQGKTTPPGILGIHTPVALAALCIGRGALAAPLAYDLGRVPGAEQRGRIAGLLTAFTSSMALFGVLPPITRSRLWACASHVCSRVRPRGARRRSAPRRRRIAALLGAARA